MPIKNNLKKQIGEGIIYPELSYRIMQIAFEIHNTLFR
jgi:hypothetical protein